MTGEKANVVRLSDYKLERPFDPKAQAEELAARNPDFAKAWRRVTAIRSAAMLVREARVEAALSQADVARTLKIHKSALSRLESYANLIVSEDGELAGTKDGPCLGSLVDILDACGFELVLSVRTKKDHIDE